MKGAVLFLVFMVGVKTLGVWGESMCADPAVTPGPSAACSALTVIGVVRKVDWSGISASGGTFDGAVIVNSSITGGDFSGTTMLGDNSIQSSDAQSTVWSGSILNGSLAFNVSTNMNGCDAQGLVGSGSLILDTVSAANCSFGLSGPTIKVENSDITSSKFNGDFPNAYFSGVAGVGAEFSGNFTNAKFLEATLTNAKFATNFRYAKISGSAQGADFQGVDLQFADLSGLNATGANFRGADLYRANFTNAILIGASFDGANISGTNFFQSMIDGSEMLPAGINATTPTPSPTPAPTPSPTLTPSSSPTLGNETANPSASPNATTEFNSSASANDTTSGSDGPCFPADALVELVNGNEVEMRALKVGDRLRSWSGAADDVFFFGHRIPTGQFEFLSLLCDDGTLVELSRDHLIFEVRRQEMIPAKFLRVGDTLQGRGAVTSRIVRVSVTIKEGLYNPHTLSGTIVVNGKFASTYNSFAPPQLSHLLLSLERLSYRAGFSLFGGLLDGERPVLLTKALTLVPRSSA
eukprot:CAMPEP_0184681300 /NCGR_PEP_ID=MMETSP0312-20130426/4281_1 /TAXON_ID=31354 /ORGANISM="Compsopogon coeruleus, Strain SAG 36.94" /LENGTH=523 /DNA_ID=CAMNT_0027132059 /DNA_START=97 /DNA_END=1668 /DNA_ORIENTATION=+